MSIIEDDWFRGNQYEPRPENEGTFGIDNDHPIHPPLQLPRCLRPGDRLKLRGAEHPQRHRRVDLLHRLVRLILPSDLRELEKKEVSGSLIC